MKFRAWLKSFRGVVWIGCLLIVGYLLVWPLMQNLWAYLFWERVPCVVYPIKGSDIERIFFMHDGQSYYTPRHDFWQTHAIDPVRTPDIPRGGTADIVYVSSGKNFQTVLRLDAHKHPERAAGRFAICGLVIVVTAALTWPRKNKVRPSAASTPPIPENTPDL